LVQRLEAWQQSLRENDLRHVWATALLAVRRGSRTKQRALSLLARSVAREPTKAAELLPLLAVLLRSVRPPERRAALAAIAEAVFQNPELRPSVEAALPELTLWEDSA
jgi:alpha-D-ribose 1-methylphosphonate 5-triphosphate synthase subunit PhnG